MRKNFKRWRRLAYFMRRWKSGDVLGEGEEKRWVARLNMWRGRILFLMLNPKWGLDWSIGIVTFGPNPWINWPWSIGKMLELSWISCQGFWRLRERSTVRKKTKKGYLQGKVQNEGKGDIVRRKRKRTPLRKSPKWRIFPGNLS